ncbi:MAG: hypothetical protein IT432_15875 [Phycisphaerales bacterium]|nr:hypothetical protein [Phycisphaerales bacterium]
MDLTDSSARSILDLAAAVERDERRIKLALLSLARAGDGPLVLEYPRDPVRNTAETAETRHVSQTPVRGFAGPRRRKVRADRAGGALSCEPNRGDHDQERCPMSTRDGQGPEGGAA